MKNLSEKDQIQSYIKQNHLEQILPVSCLTHLSLRRFDTDEHIAVEGDRVEFLYLLLEGKARVSPASEEGKIGFLDYVLANDIIGDLEYFSSDPYYYDLTALIPCIALAIPVKYIDSLFNDNVAFYKFICSNMALKMKRTSQRFSKMLLYPIKYQVVHYFYKMSVETGKSTLPIVFKETAEFFGITPRYFRSVLVELEEEGVLSRETTGVQILDFFKLRHYITHE